MDFDRPDFFRQVLGTALHDFLGQVHSYLLSGILRETYTCTQASSCIGGSFFQSIDFGRTGNVNARLTVRIIHSQFHGNNTPLMLNTDYLQADTPRLQFGNTRNSAVARQHDVSRLHFFQDTQGDVLLSLVLSEHQRLVGVDTCGDGIFVCSGFFLFPTHCRNKTQVPPLSGRSGKC